VESYFDTWFVESPGIPAVARVVLKKEALAKSHRPSALFAASCPILGCRKLGELLISVTRAGLRNLSQRVRTDKGRAAEADISTIDAIEPFTADDAIGATGRKALRDDLRRKCNELRVRLFLHTEDEANAKLQRRFGDTVTRLGLPKPDEVNYARGMKIFRLINVKPSHIGELARFAGTQSVGTFPHYTLKTSSTRVRDADPRRFTRPDPKADYPVIGIVDTGINPHHPILSPWVTKRHVHVRKGDTDHGHGSFVAGVAVHGRFLNDERFPDCPVRLVDVAVIPSTGGITEYELLDVLKEVIPQHPEVRYWNLSANTGQVDDDTFSYFAAALDDLSDRFNVTFAVSAGNYREPPLRGWPPKDLGDADRIRSPADSVRSMAVGSLAHRDGPGCCVKQGEPSPFSRRGPGPVFLPKPDLTHYGGNCKPDGAYSQTGVLSLDAGGHIAEDVGTSFSTPLVTAILATIAGSLKDEPSPCLVRALAVHSAILNGGQLAPTELRYRGFGVPGDLRSILSCSPWEATLIFEPELVEGFRFEKYPYPIPRCLFKESDKVSGEVIMTLAYDPPLDPSAGAEYCRINVDASLGTRNIDEHGKWHHTMQIPAQPKDLSKLYERHLIEHGFKWSPLKVYMRRMPRGVRGRTWGLRLSMVARDRFAPRKPQKVALIVTWRDPAKKGRVYDETLARIRQSDWIAQELRVEERVRLRT